MGGCENDGIPAVPQAFAWNCCLFQVKHFVLLACGKDLNGAEEKNIALMDRIRFWELRISRKRGIAPLEQPFQVLKRAFPQNIPAEPPFCRERRNTSHRGGSPPQRLVVSWDAMLLALATYFT